MTDTTSIPLNKLVAWSGNVRKTAGSDTGLAELAASIAAHGLLNNLIVRKDRKGKHAVIAGGRRLAALQLLADEKRIANDYLVPCQLRDGEGDHSELSLVENALREQMHPADEFEAFRNLVDKGAPVEDIAARFGVTPRVVEQRLRLARVSPVVIGAFRAGDLTLAQVMAFAISDDHARQEQILEQISHYNSDPGDIRCALTDDEIAASNRLVRFVTLKAYEKAGGIVRRDLFADDEDGIFILDRALLDQLVTKKLEKSAKAIVKEGWKWIEVRQAFDYSEWSDLKRCYAEPIPLSPEEQAELDQLNAEYDSLCETEEELTEKQQARCEEITTRCDELENREEIWTLEALAMAGAVVYIDGDGDLGVTRGLIRKEDLPAKSAKKTIADDDSPEGTAPAEESSISASLIESLTQHRSTIIGAALCANPQIALAATVHAILRQIHYDGFSRETCLQLSASGKEHHLLDGSIAAQALDRTRSQWGDRLPGNPASLWNWCLEQDRDSLLDLLAYGLAQTVDAVQIKSDDPEGERFVHADALEKALGIDMTSWFRPTAENYFGRVSKASIIEALKEARGTVAPAWEKAKKSDLAAIAEREIADTGWLPAPLKRAA